MHSEALTQSETITTAAPDKGLFIGLLILLVWVPMPLGSNRPWAWSLMEVVAFGMLINWLILYIKGRVEASAALQHAKLPIICLLLFCGVQLFQLVPLPSSLVESLRPVIKSLEPAGWLTISIDPYITFIHLRLSLALTAIFFLVLALVSSKSRLQTFAVVIVVSGVFQAVYGSLMTLSGVEYNFLLEKEFYQGTATGTFVNRNHYANYLVLCLAAGTGLLLSQLYQTTARGWRDYSRRFIATILGNKFRLRIGLAIMVIALVLTRSRMGNTSFFFSLVASGFIWLWLTHRITKGSILLLVSLIVIDTLIVGAWFGLDEVKQRIEGTAIATESRVEVNRDTWGLVKNQPFLGSGAGSYYTAFPMWRQEDITLSYDYAHNDYLQFLSEYGAIGCVPLVILLLGGLVNTIYAMRKRRTLLFQSLAFVPLMAVIAVGLHATVEFNMQMPANAATFLAILGMGWLVRYIPSSDRKRKTG